MFKVENVKFNEVFFDLNYVKAKESQEGFEKALAFPVFQEDNTLQEVLKAFCYQGCLMLVLENVAPLQEPALASELTKLVKQLCAKSNIKLGNAAQVTYGVSLHKNGYNLHTVIVTPTDEGDYLITKGNPISIASKLVNSAGDFKNTEVLYGEYALTLGSLLHMPNAPIVAMYEHCTEHEIWKRKVNEKVPHIEVKFIPPVMKVKEKLTKTIKDLAELGEVKKVLSGENFTNGLQSIPLFSLKDNSYGYFNDNEEFVFLESGKSKPCTEIKGYTVGLAEERSFVTEYSTVDELLNVMLEKHPSIYIGVHQNEEYAYLFLVGIALKLDKSRSGTYAIVGKANPNFLKSLV